MARNSVSFGAYVHMCVDAYRYNIDMYHIRLAGIHEGWDIFVSFSLLATSVGDVQE